MPIVLAELAEKKLNALTDIGNSEEFLIINFSLILQSQIKKKNKTKPEVQAMLPNAVLSQSSRSKQNRLTGAAK